MSCFNAEELGIPTLDPTMQAFELPEPLTKWGVVARTRPMPGTYHFYTSDYKFSALAARPQRLETVGCAAAVEVNFRTHRLKSVAEVLGDVARKRKLSVAWQRAGIRIMVDLAVDPLFAEINLLGVPAGWQSYATKPAGPMDPWRDLLDQDYRRAVAHAGPNRPIFTVFGGGLLVAQKCAQEGWWYCPDSIRGVAQLIR